jgi:hypothetical protein
VGDERNPHICSNKSNFEQDNFICLMIYLTIEGPWNLLEVYGFECPRHSINFVNEPRKTNILRVHLISQGVEL